MIGDWTPKRLEACPKCGERRMHALGCDGSMFTPQLGLGKCTAIRLVNQIIADLQKAKRLLETATSDDYDPVVDDVTGYAQEDLNKLRDIVST